MSTIKTSTGYVELGASDPRERAFESPNTNQPVGVRPYIARDTIRVLGVRWLALRPDMVHALVPNGQETPVKRYHNCTNCGPASNS